MIKKSCIYLIFLISLIANIYFAWQKSGFHEDEYYTYFSSNRSLGLYQPDRQWQDRQTILDEFTVREGEGFNYGLVKLVQSWDVHPPLYYFIFHTVCSFFGGLFSKWSGIITNLLAFCISFFILHKLLLKLHVNENLTLIIMAFWSLNPQTISCNMLIRMYAWLSVFIFACAYSHVKLILTIREDSDKLLIKNYIIGNIVPIMVISYLGFLTQYFYLFFFVSIGFFTALWMFFAKKRYKETIIYVFACAVSLGLAVLSYPASLSHIFGGYRGSDAAGSLFDFGNTYERITFFTGLLNDFVFAGGLSLLMIILILGIIYRMSKKYRRDKVHPEMIILVLGVVSHFLLTAKAALLVGSASNRYEMPIYGLIIVLILMGIEHYFSEGKLKKYVVPVLATVLGILLFKGLFIDGRVLFLYPEDREKIAYAVQNQNEVAVVMFNPATPHNVWRLTDELIVYSEGYYMDEENTSAITDDKLLAADKIVLYIADDDMQTLALENITSSTGLTNLKKISSEEMWVTYELTK